MRKRLGITVTTFCLILFFTLPASPAVYTWKDKDGNTVVSSSPPPPEVSQKSGQEEGSMQTEEDSPMAKKPGPDLRSKELISSPSGREGAQPSQNQVGSQQ